MKLDERLDPAFITLLLRYNAEDVECAMRRSEAEMLLKAQAAADPEMNATRVLETFGLADLLLRLWRAALRPGSLLTLDEVMQALPGQEGSVRSWILAHVKAKGEFGGVLLYSWGEVMEALGSGGQQATPLPGRGSQAIERQAPWLSTREAAVRLGIARSSLDEMVSRAPRGLPGAPSVIGSGVRRHHLRWDERTIDEWLRAFYAWEANTPKGEQGTPVKKTHTRIQKGHKRGGGEVVDWQAVVRGSSKR